MPSNRERASVRPGGRGTHCNRATNERSGGDPLRALAPAGPPYGPAVGLTAPAVAAKLVAITASAAR